MVKRWLYGAAFALACGSALSGQYWFKTRVEADAVVVEYVDRIDCGGVDAFGCYRESYGKGVIQVRRGLQSYVERCVLRHEQHHAAGFDHVSGLQPYIDCADGNWISSETLQRLGML